MQNDEAEILYLKSKKGKSARKYVKVSFDIFCKNESNVIASELYLTCTTENYGGVNNKVRFLDYNQMYSIQGIAGHLNLITKPELRLPPRGILKFTRIEIVLSPLVEDDLLLDGVVGAERAAPKSFRISGLKNNLRSFVAKALRTDEKNNEWLINEFFNEFLRKVE